MSSASYCVASDLYAHGLPRGAVANPARLAASALASTDEITLDEHGLEADQRVTFRTEGDDGALPAPLVEGTTYYAIPRTDSTFALAATAGGSAINLTADGENVLVVVPLPIAESIAWASRVIDESLPEHVVPLVAPYPEIVVMTCAELAAGKLSGRDGFVAKPLADIVDAATKRLARWAAGVPIRGENAPEPAGLAVTATTPYLDSRGWNKFGGL